MGPFAGPPAVGFRPGHDLDHRQSSRRMDSISPPFIPVVIPALNTRDENIRGGRRPAAQSRRAVSPASRTAPSPAGPRPVRSKWAWPRWVSSVRVSFGCTPRWRRSRPVAGQASIPDKAMFRSPGFPPSRRLGRSPELVQSGVCKTRQPSRDCGDHRGGLTIFMSVRRGFAGRRLRCTARLGGMGRVPWDRFAWRNIVSLLSYCNINGPANPRRDRISPPAGVHPIIEGGGRKLFGCPAFQGDPRLTDTPHRRTPGFRSMRISVTRRQWREEVNFAAGEIFATGPSC
jgi:hypothetical protein